MEIDLDGFPCVFFDSGTCYRVGIVAGGARSSSPPTCCYPGGLDVGNLLESHNGTLEQIKQTTMIKIHKSSNLNQYLIFQLTQRKQLQR